MRTSLLTVLIFAAVGCASTAKDDSFPEPPSVSMEEDTGRSDLAHAADQLHSDLDATPPRHNPWHRFTLTGSAMIIAKFDTSLRVDHKKLGDGTDIQLEDTLGLQETARIFRVDAMYRFNRSHRLDLSWYDIERDSVSKLSREIQIDDTVFPIGARLDTNLETEIIKLNWRWSFLAEDTWEFGAGLGIYWMRLDAGFSALGEAGEESGALMEDLSADVPLPVLGIHGTWAFAERFRLSGTADLLYVSIKPVSGGIIDVRLGVEWDILDWAGLGLAYNYFNLGIDMEIDDIDGKLNYEYHALMGSIYFYF